MKIFGPMDDELVEALLATLKGVPQMISRVAGNRPRPKFLYLELPAEAEQPGGVLWDSAARKILFNIVEHMEALPLFSVARLPARGRLWGNFADLAACCDAVLDESYEGGTFTLPRTETTEDAKRYHPVCFAALRGAAGWDQGRFGYDTWRGKTTSVSRLTPFYALSLLHVQRALSREFPAGGSWDAARAQLSAIKARTVHLDDSRNLLI